MTIQLTNSLSQDAPGNVSQSTEDAVQRDAVLLKELLKAELQAKGEMHDHINWIGDLALEADGLSPLALHSFLLKAEAMGKSISYRKKTIIEIT